MLRTQAAIACDIFGRCVRLPWKSAARKRNTAEGHPDSDIVPHVPIPLPFSGHRESHRITVYEEIDVGSLIDAQPRATE